MLMGVNKKGKHDGTPRFLLGPLRFASSEDVLGEGSPSLFDFFVESTFFSPKVFDFWCDQPQSSGSILAYAFIIDHGQSCVPRRLAYLLS